MEQIIAALPEWARSIFYVVLAIGGAVVFLKGKQGAPPDKAAKETSFELKAAMVDNRAVEKLSGEVAGQSIAIMGQTAALNRLADLARKWMADAEEAEERRLERRADIAEREVERLRIELTRQAALDPMRKD